jgi:5'-nucleotidase
VGYISADILGRGATTLEEPLGDLIADSQLEATSSPTTGNAVVAFMNPGGIRADLVYKASGTEGDGVVTYGEAFTVQPFGNSLVTKTMTGDQLHRVLEQQFTGCGGQISAKTLQISSSLKYESAPAAATCAEKIGRMWVDGVQVGATDTFRVTMNNFLATGGDGFTVFNEGTNALGGAQDIDALVDYFAANAPAGIAVPALDRIVPPTP